MHGVRVRKCGSLPIGTEPDVDMRGPDQLVPLLSPRVKPMRPSRKRVFTSFFLLAPRARSHDASKLDLTPFSPPYFRIVPKLPKQGSGNNFFGSICLRISFASFNAMRTDTASNDSKAKTQLGVGKAASRATLWIDTLRPFPCVGGVCPVLGQSRSGIAWRGRRKRWQREAQRRSGSLSLAGG